MNAGFSNKGGSFICKTCAKQTKPWISDLIDNLDNFKQFANLSGGSTVINRLINSGKTQAIGAAWVMKYVKKKNMNPDSFEDFIESTAEFSADITFQGKFIECKSWGGKIAGLGNVPNQMINYFNTQSSLGNFKFEFDPDRYVPTPSDLNQALKANIGLFIDTPQSWTKFNSIFKTTINPMDLNRFDVLIDKITTPEYFSKIINPVD